MCSQVRSTAGLIDFSPQVSVATMALIWLFVPLKPVEGKFMEKIRDMDWIGSFLSLAMTLCILVSLLILRNTVKS